MVQKVTEYVTTLERLDIHKNIVEQTEDVLTGVVQVQRFLVDPSIPVEQKHDMIDKIFPVEIRNFLKILCDNQDIDLFSEISDSYIKRKRTDFHVEEAVLRYVTEPTLEQYTGIKKFIEKEIPGVDIKLKLEKDDSLMGGFILKLNNKEYDWSMRARLDDVRKSMTNSDNSSSISNSGQEIISILRTQIEESDFDTQSHEVGTVCFVGDGIVNIDGLDHVMYGEIVIFDNGVKGMVQDIKRDRIGCILFGEENGIKAGNKVIRSGRQAGIGVGNAMLGRIVDALGAPIDGLGEIHADTYWPLEKEAPGIIDRKSVNEPLETGILAIDSMFPIGKGQRELIIGDRQTGKTAIAVDTILNQKGKDVICVYVAIGQKASTVSKIVNTLQKHGAMEYSVIVNASASDPASLQYIAPYSGTAIAEYYMHQGKDVLIIYDDLSKHAVAYRALSLLLERSPGREAYPGDVFYLHSRLLERSSKLNEQLGGGSITALPIIETQAGDVSAYIPTNVISITDGQIFLESDLFFEGQRPAVNVGLSVSRVGGAAQTKAMKKAAGSIRIDLAQYREMEVFTQFSSDLDEDTKAQLQYGNSLMELLKQPLYRPLSLAEQVVILLAATGHLFKNTPISSVKEKQMGLLEYMNERYSEIMRTIETDKVLSDELKQQVLDAANEYFND